MTLHFIKNTAQLQSNLAESGLSDPAKSALYHEKALDGNMY